MLSNKIISSDKDLVGVVLYGTVSSMSQLKVHNTQDKHKNSGDFKHVFVLQDIDQPFARRILDLEELKGKLRGVQDVLTRMLQRALTLRSSMGTVTITL